jgi:hypothetical protein
MIGRLVAAALALGGLIVAFRAQADEMRPAVDRPDIMEVGDPMLITRKTLAFEMRRNVELRDWVHLYGAPDYAEIQEIQIDPPFASYEVRLYYLKRNAYLAFGRANVAPNIYDYGVRKYIGSINPSELDRLLTARPAVAYASAQTAPATVAPAAVDIQTIPVEGVPVRN